jgi:hypothetical protein
MLFYTTQKFLWRAFLFNLCIVGEVIRNQNKNFILICLTLVESDHSKRKHSIPHFNKEDHQQDL